MPREGEREGHSVGEAHRRRDIHMRDLHLVVMKCACGLGRKEEGNMHKVGDTHK
jgi:hypothetical protein